VNNTPWEKNLPSGDWIMFSPHLNKRPWLGKKDKPQEVNRDTYNSSCYMCLGKDRLGGVKNPYYEGVYVFKNDLIAILENPDESNQKRIV